MTEERRIVTASPENSETPLGDAQSWVTPNRLFFVRNHFDVPEINEQDWQLQIAGGVHREIELDWAQLNALPQRSVFATMECAGNGRSFLQPQVEGVQWGAGAVGHAEWTGVPLQLVLQRAGLRDDVVEIVFTGADCGAEAGHEEPMPFSRSLPLEKALDENTLLVLRMNGERLAPSHGFPVRLLVPGWYGVASLKWLQRIEAVNQPYQGYYQTAKYTISRRTGRGETIEVVGAMPVKSEILQPGDHAELGIGTTRIFGLAWAGEDAVEAVELSTDAGQSWHRAELIGPQASYSWNLWEYLWEVADGGDHVLMSRAISESGRVQPQRHDDLRGGYLINFSRPTRVRVNPAVRSEQMIGDAASLMREMSVAVEERSRLPLDVELELTYGAGI